MPSLRLPIEDARDIASYLMTQKHADATYAAADYMDDPQLQRKAKISSATTAAPDAMKSAASKTKAASAPS